MNIFYLDPNPILSAQYLCNRHVVKMVLEGCQILSFAHHHVNSLFKDRIYRPTHKNHPCMLWVVKNAAHYQWLLDHTKAISAEYTYRYDKIHKCTELLNNELSNFPHIHFSSFETPPQCMPDFCKCGDTVKAYRNYYNMVKGKTIDCRWKKRGKPFWFDTQTT